MHRKVSKNRSKNMAAISGKDTKPELLLRSYLHKNGLRYRLHCEQLPGRPDLVFPRSKAVIFVHGCFWHSHNCQKFSVPKTNKEFWARKLYQNQKRDEENIASLLLQRWRVLIVWECALRGKTSICPRLIVEEIRAWIYQHTTNFLEIRGNGSQAYKSA